MSLDLGTLVGHLELESDKFEGVLDKLPEKLKGSGVLMGGAAAVVAAGVGAALAKGIDTGLDLQDAQNSLKAQLGLTQSESQRLGGVAGKLYASAYGDSIEATSDAVADVVSSIGGMKDANASAVQDMTAKVLNFNTTFGVDTERTTQVVGQLLKGGLVKDANEGMDLLTAAMQKVPKATRDDIMDAADEYGPFFKQLGFSGADAMGVLVEGAKKGQFGIDKAGDALKEFSIRATDLTDTNAQASMKALGLDGAKMADDLLAGGSRAKGAMDTVNKALLGVKDPSKQAYLATQLYGTQLEDLNKGQLKGFLSGLTDSGAALGKTAGAADKMGKAVNGGARVGFTELSRSFEMMIGQVGQKLVPALTAIMDWANKNPAIMQVVVGVVLGLAVAFGILAAVMWVIALNPITLMIMGIVAGVALLAAGVYLLVTNWGAVVTWLTGVWGGFVGWFMGLLNTVLAWFAGLGATILGAVITGWSAVVAWFQAIPAAVLGFFAGVGSWLLGIGRSMLDGLLSGVRAGAAALWTFYVVLPQKVLGYLAGAAGWLLGVGRSMLSGMVSGVTAGATALWSFLTSLPGRVKGYLSSAASWLVSIGKSVISGMVSGVTGALGLIATAVGNIKGKVTGAITGAGSWLTNIGANIIQGLVSGIKGALGSVGSAVGSAANSIKDKFTSILGIHSPSLVFAGYGLNIGQGLINGLAKIAPSVNDAVGGLVAPLSGTSLQLGGSGVGTGGTGGSGAPAAGTVVDASVTITGNVGWDKADLDRERASRLNQALALNGLDTPLVTV